MAAVWLGPLRGYPLALGAYFGTTEVVP